MALTSFMKNVSPQNVLRILIAGGVIFYFVLIAIFERYYVSEYSNRIQMNLYIPWGFIAIFISFYIFREYNRVKKARQEERREEINQRRQELLDNVIKAKKKPEVEELD